MVMLAMTCAALPALSAGSLLANLWRGSSPGRHFGDRRRFIFGMGMQFGGGCASGTLYTVGGGSTRMVITLIAFIVGSVVATAHVPFWTSLPQFKPFSMVWSLVPLPAIAFNLVVFAAMAGLPSPSRNAATGDWS